MLPYVRHNRLTVSTGHLHSFASFMVSSPASSLGWFTAGSLFRYAQFHEIQWDQHDQIQKKHHEIPKKIISLQASCVSLIDVSTGPSDASSAFSFENILRICRRLQTLQWPDSVLTSARFVDGISGTLGIGTPRLSSKLSGVSCGYAFTSSCLQKK